MAFIIAILLFVSEPPVYQAIIGYECVDRECTMVDGTFTFNNEKAFLKIDEVLYEFKVNRYIESTRTLEVEDGEMIGYFQISYCALRLFVRPKHFKTDYKNVIMFTINQSVKY